MLLLGSFLVFMLFFGVAVTGFGFLPRSQTSGVPGRNLTLTTLLAEAGAPAGEAGAHEEWWALAKEKPRADWTRTDALMLMAALVLVGVLGYGASRLTFDAFARVMSVVGLLAMVALTFGLYLHPEVLERVLNWVRGLGLLGHAIMTLSFVVVSLPLTVGCVVLAMCCGFIYGFWVGSLTACLGLLIGGVVSFWGLSKLLKQPVMRYVRGKPKVIGQESVLFLGRGSLFHFNKLFAIMRALRDNQWYVSLVLRPSPVPLGLQNGLLAITVPFHVFLATLPAVR